MENYREVIDLLLDHFKKNYNVLEYFCFQCEVTEKYKDGKLERFEHFQGVI